MARHTNEILNRLLIGLDKSLLSYVDEAWPWSGRGQEAERQAVAELGSSRREHVQQLCDYLLDREYPVDFGAYPTEYTDLHYVALDYLLKQIIENQRRNIQRIEQAHRDATEADAKPLLDSLLEGEQGILSRLEELVRSRAAVAAG